MTVRFRFPEHCGHFGPQPSPRQFPRAHEMSIPVVAFAVVGAAVVLFVLWYWNESNNKDLGTMSRQWLAEYNASHP
jgi:hypothetical protein